MRTTPISVDIEQAKDVKTINLLVVEVKDLVLKLLNTNKRTLSGEIEKIKYKAKLSLYCSLYRKVRDRFIKLNKVEKSSLKPPPDFETLIKEWNWSKTVKYSTIDDDVEDVAEIVEEVTAIDLSPENIDEDMKKFFNRNDKEAVETAINHPLSTFLNRFRGETTTEALERAYHEIRTQHARKGGKLQSLQQPITDRVGEEKNDEPLAPLSPVTGEAIKVSEEDRELLDTPVQALAQEEVEEMLQEEHSNPGMLTTEELVAEDFTSPLSEIIDTIQSPLEITGEIDLTNQTNLDSIAEEIKPEEEAIPFKNYPKEKKLEIVQSYYDSGLTKGGEIKKKMVEDGYVINHYDDVYNVFIKIKK